MQDDYAFQTARVSEVRARHQPYTGPMYGDSIAVRKQLLLGQASPIVRARMQLEHGRFLSGLGGESPSGDVGIDPAYQSQAEYELEMQDDVYGSGIFDPPGRSGTSNANMGVFASHYSLPGYVARNVPFTVSRDVSDITSGAEVVYVPAGGMVYVEQRGRLTRPAVLGPTWRPPMIEPAGVTERDQPYAFLNRPCSPPAPPLHPNAPVRPAPTYHPARNPTTWTRTPPALPPSCNLPRQPPQGILPRRNTVTPDNPGIAIRAPQPCPAAARAMGADDSGGGASKAQLAVAGLIAGAAVGLVAHIVRKRR